MSTTLASTTAPTPVRRRPEPETRASTNLAQVRRGLVRFRHGLFAHVALTTLPEGRSVYLVADGAHAVHVYLPGTPKRGQAYCRATRVPAPKKADPSQLALAEVAQ